LKKNPEAAVDALKTYLKRTEEQAEKHLFASGGETPVEGI